MVIQKAEPNKVWGKLKMYWNNPGTARGPSNIRTSYSLKTFHQLVCWSIHPTTTTIQAPVLLSSAVELRACAGVS